MNSLKTIDRVPSIAFKSLLPLLLAALLLTSQSVLGQTDAGTVSEQDSGQTQSSSQPSRNPANPPIKLDDSPSTPESGNIWKRKYLLGDVYKRQARAEAKI